MKIAWTNIFLLKLSIDETIKLSFLINVILVIFLIALTVTFLLRLQ